jgi:hypothetical protein
MPHVAREVNREQRHHTIRNQHMRNFVIFIILLGVNFVAHGHIKPLDLSSVNNPEKAGIIAKT